MATSNSRKFRGRDIWRSYARLLDQSPLVSREFFAAPSFTPHRSGVQRPRAGFPVTLGSSADADWVWPELLKSKPQELASFRRGEIEQDPNPVKWRLGMRPSTSDDPADFG